MAGLTSILDRLLFEGVVTAHIATTEEEKRAIQAFRYSIYVEELGKTVVNADHTHKRIADAADNADNADNAVLIYTGSVADITGSVRIEFFGPGEVPKAVRNRFSMDRFEDIDLHGVSVSSRMTVDRSRRGQPTRWPPAARARARATSPFLTGSEACSLVGDDQVVLQGEFSGQTRKRPRIPRPR